MSEIVLDRRKLRDHSSQTPQTRSKPTHGDSGAAEILLDAPDTSRTSPA